MNRHIINSHSTVIQALRQLNELSGGVMTLVVTNDNGKMLGTLTDGDIRRGLLNGITPDDPLSAVTHTAFHYLRADATPRRRVEAMRHARRKNLKLLPELNSDGTISRLIDLTRTHTILPLSAILMAGGKGERLRPMTLTVPKPLLKIAGRPIIDYNVENLARCGISDVWVTVKYLAGQIKEYFSNPCHGITVKCIEEEKSLGTIGAAALVPRNIDGDTLVMNSDLLTTIDLEEMYIRHVDEHADITIAAIPYSLSVPYAILSTDGSRVKTIEEKPTYSYFANAGIYIFSNRVLSALSPDERTDATDLIEAAINEGMKVTYYPINGTWIDIGSPADFSHAEEIMKHHRSLTNRC